MTNPFFSFFRQCGGRHAASLFPILRFRLPTSCDETGGCVSASCRSDCSGVQSQLFCCAIQFISVRNLICFGAQFNLFCLPADGGWQSRGDLLTGRIGLPDSVGGRVWQRMGDGSCRAFALNVETQWAKRRNRFCCVLDSSYLCSVKKDEDRS